MRGRRVTTGELSVLRPLNLPGQAADAGFVEDAGVMERLGRACVRHRVAVVSVWVVALIAVAVGGALAGTRTTDDPDLPGTQSQTALDLLVREFPQPTVVSSNVLYAPASGAVTDPANRAAIEASVARVSAVAHVAAVKSPFTPAGAAGLSPDGRVAYASVTLDIDEADLDDADADAIVDAARSGAPDGLHVVVGGSIGSKASPPQRDHSEAVGLTAAAIILLAVFGSVVAMGLPIVTALIGLAAGLSLITLAGHVIEVPTLGPTLGAMIGLGVGIDYALFVVSRHRRQLAAGMTVETSIALTVATSGAAILFAGGTVVIALCSLALAGIPEVSALGYTAAIVVVTAVLAAITLLPALLAVLGRRIDALAIPALTRRRTPAQEPGAPGTPARGWQRWGEAVARRPWVALIAGVAILLALCAPATALHLGQTDGGDAAKGSEARQVFDLMSEGFGPGSNGQLVLVVDLTDLDKGVVSPVEQLAQALRQVPGIAQIGPPIPGRNGKTALVEITPTTAPASPRTEELVERIRHDVIGPTLHGTGVSAYLGGKTAGFVDLADEISGRLPRVILTVIALSFVLLLIAFRSVVVPLKAAFMNLLSVGAAYGVVTAVFQNGWGERLVGLDQSVPIVSFVPLMMFAILFGLSMDYEVFLLSQVQERWRESGDARQAVVQGLATTGGIITAAALIMVCVFGSFVLSDNPTVKQFGLGMAVAVAIDATLVRCLLVPAILVLVGRASWWLPAWLDRALPHFEIERGPRDGDGEPKGSSA
jgi:RND superfamily putative drug exporter